MLNQLALRCIDVPHDAGDDGDVPHDAGDDGDVPHDAGLTGGGSSINSLQGEIATKDSHQASLHTTPTLHQGSGSVHRSILDDEQTKSKNPKVLHCLRTCPLTFLLTALFYLPVLPRFC